MKYLCKLITLFLFSLIALAGCQPPTDPKDTVKVGTISGPETQLMEVAKTVAKNKFHLNVEITQFSDYSLPNTALNDGSIDANMFQHEPYLKQTIQDRNYSLIAIGKTFIYPMGIYSKKITKLSDLANRATIAIPNDPTNEARALLLCVKAGLIRLKPNTSVNSTLIDIISNPKQLQFKELDAAQLPRALSDVDLAVINTNYAIPAGLLPNRDALYLEDKNSAYANLVVIRSDSQGDKRFTRLLNALHSQEVLQTANRLFKGQAIAAWQ